MPLAALAMEECSEKNRVRTAPAWSLPFQYSTTGGLERAVCTSSLAFFFSWLRCQSAAQKQCQMFATFQTMPNLLKDGAVLHVDQHQDLRALRRVSDVHLLIVNFYIYIYIPNHVVKVWWIMQNLLKPSQSQHRPMLLYMLLVLIHRLVYMSSRMLGTLPRLLQRECPLPLHPEVLSATLRVSSPPNVNKNHDQTTSIIIDNSDHTHKLSQLASGIDIFSVAARTCQFWIILVCLNLEFCNSLQR